MEVKKPNKSLLFYAFVVMIILILLNALVIPKISERSVTETTYDEFLALLDAKYVKQVEIDNSSEVIYYEAAKDGVTRDLQDRSYERPGSGQSSCRQQAQNSEM